VLDHGASVILMSHLGRPKGGKVEPEFSAQARGRLPVRADCAVPVKFAPDCIGPEVKAMAEERCASEPHILLLENLRFHKEEEGKVKLPETATDEEKKAAKAEMKKKQEEFARNFPSWATST
jgi:phosphoglycerate kinase